MLTACDGKPPTSRRTMFGGVRTASRTDRAPPSTRSTAISAPVLPAPTTSTSRPAYGEGLRYADACTSSPVKPSRPGQSGSSGVWLCPVATTTWPASRSSPPVPTSQPAVRPVDPADLGAQQRPQPVVGGVPLQVVDHVGPRDIPAIAARHPQTGQLGELAGRVQVQPVVVPAPAGPDRVRAVDDQGVEAAPAQHRRPPRARPARLPAPPPARARASSAAARTVSGPSRTDHGLPAPGVAQPRRGIKSDRQTPIGNGTTGAGVQQQRSATDGWQGSDCADPSCAGRCGSAAHDRLPAAALDRRPRRPVGRPRRRQRPGRPARHPPREAPGPAAQLAAGRRHRPARRRLRRLAGRPAPRRTPTCRCSSPTPCSPAPSPPSSGTASGTTGTACSTPSS